MKVDLDTQLQPVTSDWNDKQLKHKDPASQVTNASSDGEEMKLDADKAPHEVPASSTEMNIDTTQPVISLSNDEESQQETPFSVVIFSPGGTRNRKPKRTIPEPEPQPSVKKRGRPRKIQPKQSEPESSHVELSQEKEVSQRDEQSTTGPFSVMGFLTAQIAENNRAAAESSLPKPSQGESLCSVLSSTPEPQRFLGPQLSTSIEAVSITNINGKNHQAELLQSSTAQSYTSTDSVKASVEAQIEAPVEAERDEINNSPNTEQQKDPVPTPSPTTGSDLDEIIVPNIPSPGALVSKILQIDGRVPNGRPGNAWKAIRCYRNNQDMGSLFDVREAWFLQHGRLR